MTGYTRSVANTRHNPKAIVGASLYSSSIQQWRKWLYIYTVHPYVKFDGMWEKESIIDVKREQENSSLVSHCSCEDPKPVLYMAHIISVIKTRAFSVAAVAEQCGNTRDCKPSNCILGYTPICTSTNRCTCKMDMQTNPPTTTMAMATATTQGSGRLLLCYSLPGDLRKNGHSNESTHYVSSQWRL